MAYGLPAEEAARAVTLYAARILGLEQEVGSLVPGRRADVVVTDAHLLEITSKVRHVFIDGERTQIPLTLGQNLRVRPGAKLTVIGDLAAKRKLD